MKQICSYVKHITLLFHTFSTINRPVFDYITSCLSCIYGIVHVLISILIFTCRRIREKKSNQLLLNMSIGYAFCGFSNLAGVMLPFLDTSISIITFAGYSYSNVALVFLTIDRCLYIRWPFRYNSFPRVLHVFFIACSPASAAYTIYKALAVENNSHVTDDVNAMRTFIFGIATIMIILLSTNSLVFCTLRSQRRKIKKLHVVNFQSNSKPNFSHRRKEILAFYICLGCVLTYVLLWFPPLLVTIINFYTQITISYYYFSLSMIAVSLNPLSDAIIFVCFNKDLKNRLFQLCCRGCATKIHTSANSRTDDVSTLQTTTM